VDLTALRRTFTLSTIVATNVTALREGDQTLPDSDTDTLSDRSEDADRDEPRRKRRRRGRRLRRHSERAGGAVVRRSAAQRRGVAFRARLPDARPLGGSGRRAELPRGPRPPGGLVALDEEDFHSVRCAADAPDCVALDLATGYVGSRSP